MTAFYVRGLKERKEIVVPQSCLTLCHPSTVACQAPLSMEFSRQAYWSWLPFPSPGDFQTQGLNWCHIEGRFVCLFYHLSHWGSPWHLHLWWGPGTNALGTLIFLSSHVYSVHETSLDYKEDSHLSNVSVRERREN